MVLHFLWEMIYSPFRKMFGKRVQFMKVEASIPVPKENAQIFLDMNNSILNYEMRFYK